MTNDGQKHYRILCAGVAMAPCKSQLLMREYLIRRVNAILRYDQPRPARCPLQRYGLNYLTIQGSPISTPSLKACRQAEVREKGYEAGAQFLKSAISSG